MSIAAFYRTEIPMVQEWGYYESGTFKKSFSDIVYTKGNVQPWKEGERVNNPAGGVYFSEYTIIYIKEIPEFTTTLPPDIDSLALVGTRVWIEDRWFNITGTQNWRRAGRGPKHYKLQANYTTGPGIVYPPTPETSQRTVEALFNETYELEQVLALLP